MTWKNGSTTMRKVKQLGFLVVNKQKPQPKRYIKKLSVNGLIRRKKQFRFWYKLPYTKEEDILTALKATKSTNTFDVFSAGSLIRLTINRDHRSSHTLNTRNCTFGWYKRCVTTYLFIIDYNQNQTFVFGHRKRNITTEKELWESSDVNYWGT